MENSFLKNIYLILIPQIIGCWSMLFIIWQLIVKPFLEPNLIIKITEIILCFICIILLSWKTIIPTIKELFI